MVVYNNVLAGAAGSGGAAAYEIERSLRFNKNDAAHLNKTFSAGNRRTWTWSGWAKLSTLSGGRNLWACYNGTYNIDDFIQFYVGSDATFIVYVGSSVAWKSNEVFRDPSAWYHFVISFDTTRSSANDILKVWVNGQQITRASGAGFSLNTDYAINNTIPHRIGTYNGSSELFDGYMAEIHFLDGIAVSDPDGVFGEFDADTGVWNPIEFTPSTEYSTSAITSTTSLTNSFTTDDNNDAFGSGNIDEGTYSRKVNGGTLTVTLSPAQSGNFVVYTGSVNENSRYTIIFEDSNGSTYTVLNNSTSPRTGPGNTCTVNAGQRSNIVGFTVDCQDANDSQLCGVTLDGDRLVNGSTYGTQVTLTDGTNLSEFPVNTVVSNGDKVIARNTTNNTLSLDGTSWATGQYVTKGGYGTNGFHLDFSDNSSNAALGYDAAGSNDWTVNNLSVQDYVNYTNGTYTVVSGGSILYPDRAFNGSTQNYTIQNGIQSGTNEWTWEPTTPVTGITTLKLYLVRSDASGSASDFQYKINDGNYVDSGVAQNNDALITISNPPSTLSKLSFKSIITNNSNGLGLSGVQVNGTYLANNDGSGNDSLLDSPTNYEADSGNNGGNYATLNPLDKNSSATLTNGNLDYDKTGTGGYGLVKSTIAVSSGKWYCEYTLTGTGQTVGVTLASHSVGNQDYLQSIAGGFGYYSLDGDLYTSSGGSAYGSSFAVGDTIGIALDMDNGKLFFSKNGVFQNSGNPVSGTNPAASGLSGDYVFGVHSGTQGSTTAAGSYNFGQRPFTYTPPTGFKSLCTQNLDDPLIVDPSTAMDVTKWTGDGSSSRAITGLNMSPDLLWVKRRNSALDHFLWDSVRGVTKELYSNQNYEEGTTTNKLESLDSNGFTVKNNSAVNANNDTYVAWAWDAGSSNTSISVGGLNSSAYNQSQNWSALGTGDASAPYNWEATFDGASSSYGAIPPNGQAALVDFSGLSGGGISYSESVVVTYNRNSNAPDVTVNGSAIGATADGTDRTYTLSGSGTLTSVGTQTRTVAGAGDCGIKKIVVDGKELVDQGVTPAVNYPSIASTVRANPTAGFSIVNYTGNGTIGAKVGHGLNANVALYFMKNRSSAANWAVLGHALNDAFGGSNKYLVLNSTGAAGNAGQGPGDSSTIELWNDATNNANGDNYLCLAFAPVEGYSAFGSYVSNNSTDGPFVYLGFQPKLIIWKNLEANHGWYMYDDARDPDNPMSKYLAVHDSIAEGDPGGVMDVLSNGFKIRNTGLDMNNNSNTILYMAWAEHPFKTARAR